MNSLPKQVKICEVGLRDGLQNEKKQLTTEEKLALLDMITASGIQSIEIGSLVSPRAVPSQADTDEVFRRAQKAANVEYRVLIMNQRGLLRAKSAGVHKAKLTVSASRTHCLQNQRRTPEQVMDSLAELKGMADDCGIELSGAIATAFGCPFEGVISIETLLPLVDRFAEMGVQELSLSDTTGMANPAQVYETCRQMQNHFPEIIWNLHFHNTRGLGFANVFAGLEAGITRYDASFGGLGGCPFAPGASGNIATEDLAHMLSQMGIETGVDLDAAIVTASQVQTLVGHEVPSFLLKAGKSSDLHQVNDG